mmetsp:Transcript_8518/g.25286  ORF Transcript_8518/g.25286 Transcript_8518/m.25286 type:complete len:224 (-) Transcript_8518:870-1541(-)
MRYRFAGEPRQSTKATLCNSPPLSCFTLRSKIGSISMGRATSAWNWGCVSASPIFASRRSRTVPLKWVVRLCGLYDTFNSGKPSSSFKLSGLRSPASIRMNVVLPVPFCPNITRISLRAKPPAWTSKRKPRSPIDFCNSGYAVIANLSSSSTSSVCSEILKVKATSRNRKFSVGILPSKKTLMPSRTPKGIVTTPYAPGEPQRQHTKSDKYSSTARSCSTTTT